MNQKRLHRRFINKDTSENQIVKPHTVGIVNKERRSLSTPFFASDDNDRDRSISIPTRCDLKMKIKLDYAMKRHIHYLVRIETKPFCFRDFSHFNVDGQEYSMAHGTFRNKISKLVRAGYAEQMYDSGPAFIV